ncbi:B12-binding domain-containing radical SAM protein [Candidatus Omnitrophota bacterium]
MKKKILLTILPVYWPKMPPIGIGYLQSFLLNKGIKADVLDLNNIFYNLSPQDLKKSWLRSCNVFLEKNILSILRNHISEEYNSAIEKILKYDMVGFSCFKSNLKTTLKVVKILKSRKNNIQIILGGPEITRQYFKTSGAFTDEIKAFSNLIVAGEGELPLFNYIAEKDKNHKIASFCELENLEELPFPEYRDIDLKDYSRTDSIPILFSRGCSKKCAFCSERLLYKRSRMRPVENVIEEIAYHRARNKIEYFIFHDSMINFNIQKLENLCDKIIENFGSIRWEAQLYIRDDMRQGLLEKIKKSGCYNLFIGLESGCDRTLQNMNKGFTTQNAILLFKKLRDAGLPFGVSLIAGYPGEGDKDFQEGLDFLIQNKKLIPKIEQVNPFTYYDGTDADKNFDYAMNSISLKRLKIFINEIKKHGFKYTNAFLGNLIEKNDPLPSLT